MNKTLTVAVAAALLQAFTVCSHGADQLFDVTVRAVSITTNQSGNVIYGAVRNGDLIRKCASDEGITNLSGLMLVYDRTADALKVVMGTNNTVVCTPLSFEGGVSLPNTNGTRIERLAFVFAGTNTVANGTLAATERLSLDSSNQLTSFRLVGRLQYAVPASGTNPPVIYNGTLVAGSDMEGDEHGEGEGHGKGHGGHGHSEGED